MDTAPHPQLSLAGNTAAVPLSLVAEAGYADWLARQSTPVAAWLRVQGFRPERGRLLTWPDREGRCAGAVAGLGARPEVDQWFAAGLAARLPAADYTLAAPLAGPDAATLFVLGWLLGGYRFTRYRNRPDPVQQPCLVPPAGADLAYARAAAEALALARDLINTPANDLGPAELEQAARELAQRAGGTLQVVQGEALRQGYPLIEAVGRGSPRAPRLLDLRFERGAAPRVTLVGKGVCFDSGGLDIKPSAAMLLMKKDMGGAACALALAQLLRALDAPVDLRVLVPAVENSVDGASFRPGDVLRSRKGLSVEIGNTDAEGRLVLADALADASDGNPDLLIDMATLTGAARVALGPDLPPVFSGDRELLDTLVRQGERAGDPVWPMPLWDAYDDELASRVADVNNAGSSSFAGAITAALFLRRFVAQPARWVHVDLYGWNPKERPGRPLGAEVQGLRALYGLIRQRCG